MTEPELERITSDNSYGIGYRIDACMRYQNQRIARNWYYGNYGYNPWGIRPPGQTSYPSAFVTRIPSSVDYRASQLKRQQQQQSAMQGLQMLGALAGAMAAYQQSDSGYVSPEGQHAPGTCGRK